ncbi:signal peptide containing protein [Theileria equi strain WA]|uniref:Signal peptide containing protein n=1 Tax=Theileria equi strain WA TaxID=1537102 RepID=L1LFE3_THEEQ|nr:signal peptide containing protein [Theileria equi strain WA]EKX73994.1 signal peptide containing protein [Theileria equi strain WA]|eukprot:XP_004833446.1 signal peptide containing protein [Theileria equi strain WA]
MNTCTRSLILLILLSIGKIFADHGNMRHSTKDIEPAIFIEEVPLVVPQKTPINIDLTRDPSHEVMVIKIDETSEDIHYMIRPELDENYKIADISENGRVISEDSDRIVERLVYFHREYDGAKVIKSIDKYINDDGNTAREILEFIKRQEDDRYVPLVRYPVDVDLLSADIPNEIERIAYTSPETKTFKIRAHLANRAYIGVVKYGGITVTSLLSNDIISRQIVLDTSETHPVIRIASHMRNKSVIYSRYKFVVEENVGTIIHEEEEEVH